MWGGMASKRVKSGVKSGTFQKGDDPRRGRGPAKGHGGRPPIVFKMACSDLTDNQVLPKVQTYLESTKADPSDSSWRWCAQFVADYGKGKPTQHVDVTSRHEDALDQLE